MTLANYLALKSYCYTHPAEYFLHLPEVFGERKKIVLLYRSVTIEIKACDKGAISLRASDVLDSEEEFIEFDVEILIE